MQQTTHRRPWTGYTHQWRSRPAFKSVLMASINPDEDPTLARSRGWRTFRIGSTPVDGAEVTCPAYSTENSVQCADCMLCSGANGAKSIQIPDHSHGASARCYVNIGQAPLSVWRAYKRGIYSRGNDSGWYYGRSLRWGAYGDPAALPIGILHAVNRQLVGKSAPSTSAKPRGNGVVLYEGPSMLDGAPIVCIATGWARSNNRKTGAMLQTWILRSDIDPVAASHASADASVCGSCPLRWALQRKGATK